MSNPMSNKKESLCMLIDRSCGMVVSSASVVSGLNQYDVSSLLSSVSTVVVSLNRMVVSCLTKGLVC